MHPRAMTPLLAVVDLGGDPRWLWVIAGVFVLTFLAVCGIAYLLLARRTRHSSGGSTWQFNMQAPLPASKGAVDFISKVAAVGISRPEVTPETRPRLDALAAPRAMFVTIYRSLMITVGLVGLTAAAFLIRSHTPANMNLLPGSILALLSLGALLSGLIPGPSIVRVEPIDPDLLDKIQIKVTPGSPLTSSLSESDVQQAAEALRQGVSIADAARAVHDGYDRLEEVERRALESALEQAVRATGSQ
jgi:hypothetical protein